MLDHGKVIEFGHPHVLLQNKEGEFRGMCEQSGELEALEKMARTAYEECGLGEVEVMGNGA